MKAKVFTIKNSLVAGLANWLAGLSLKGKNSRWRTRFVSLLIERVKENRTFYNDLLKEHANLDEKGNPKKKKDADGVEVWDLKDEDAFKKSYEDLMDEDFSIDITPSNKVMFEKVQEMVLETTEEFGPRPTDTDEQKVERMRAANDYDKWCQAFELLV